ncbi:MAG: tyrosine-type recombinase/integrase, partial [Actinomycetes bacterium]
MGWTTKRAGLDGKPRYRACYRDARGRTRSAGTFSNKREADRAWQQAELLLAQGRLGGADTGKLSFARYVDDVWFPHHVLEPSTRETYRYSINKHLMPFFGPMRMAHVLPGHVREWVSGLVAAGVTPATIRHNKIILSAIFTTALNDQVTLLHPCRGVKTPTVPVKAIRILTPEQFDALYAALPDDQARLLVETAIDSGLRWGELTELRGKDLDPLTGILTVSRAVVQVDPKFHPQGERFHIKPYPKSRLARRLKLSRPVVHALVAHQRTYQLQPDDLLFQAPGRLTAPPLRLVIADDAADDPGLTEPNAQGRQYVHGTLSAYTAGRCRCDRCRRAMADYWAGRREQGKDDPRRPRVRETDGHLPGLVRPQGVAARDPGREAGPGRAATRPPARARVLAAGRRGGPAGRQ